MGRAPTQVGRAVLRARGIWKSYNGRAVLADVNVEARRGELTVIIGPNGAGKTTLLRILAGLEPPDRGTVEAHGRVLLVFQENLLLPWRRLRDNILLGLKYHGVPRGERLERLRRVAELLGITEHLDKYPGEVSGGTARKAAIARMLVLEPDVLLLDEPLAGLDASSRRSLLEALRSLARQGRAIILVDHSLSDVASYADVVYVLSQAPGRVIARLGLRGLAAGERIRLLYEAMLRASQVNAA